MSSNKARQTRIVIVEDDARLRRVYAEVFENARNCAVVGSFADGASAISGAPPLKPDVIFMDINLPDTTGVACVETLSPLLPDCRILMLTIYQDSDVIFNALAAGAHGYLVKPIMPREMIASVETIQSGGAPISPSIARKVIDFFHCTPRPASESPAPDLMLSAREQQVLDHLVNGLSQKEMADNLGIAISTVNTYVQRIYEKLHVRSRRELIAQHTPGRNQA
jgi:DNA-binding NarL/FixJ family response regulator